MKLYYSPGACSLSVHIAAREAGLDPAPREGRPRLSSYGGRHGLLHDQPEGYVPSIALPDGAVLTEVAALSNTSRNRSPRRGSRRLPAPWTARGSRNGSGSSVRKSTRGSVLFWNPATPDAVKDATKKKLAQRFAYLDRSSPTPLPDGFDVHGGRRVSFTILSWARHLAVDLAPYEHLRAFLDRVGARPKVREALVAEGLVKSA